MSITYAARVKVKAHGMKADGVRRRYGREREKQV